MSAETKPLPAALVVAIEECHEAARSTLREALDQAYAAGRRDALAEAGKEIPHLLDCDQLLDCYVAGDGNGIYCIESARASRHYNAVAALRKMKEAV